MKKILLHYFPAYFVVVLCSCFFPGQNLLAQTKPPVRSVTEFAIETKGGKSIEIKRFYQEYDQRGNLVNEIDYDSEGKVQEELKYEYNTLNQKVKETDYDSNGKVQEERKYEYNTLNQKVKEIHSTPEGKINEMTTYEYDEKGDRVLKIVTEGNGKLKSKKKYVYEYN